MNSIKILFLVLILLVAITPVSAQYDYADITGTLLTQIPDPGKAGDVVELRIRVANEGYKTSENVIAELIEEYPFTLVSGEESRRELGELVSSEKDYRTLTYKVLINKNAIDGQHEIKFRISENNGVSWKIYTFNVDVTSKEFAQIIYIDKIRITPGVETPLTFTINNIGKAPLTNMVFSWSEENDVVLPVGTDNTRYIPFLDTGESMKIKYNVIANPTATRGLYTIDLKLDFDARNENGSASSDTIETHSGILVGGDTDFDIAFSENDGDKTSLSIANIGENDASSVTVSIPKQKGFTVKGGLSAIIGNLNKGDFTIATFQLIPINQTGKEEVRNLNVEISYTNSFGDRHRIQKSIELKIDKDFGLSQNSNRNAGASPIIPIIIVVLIVGIFLFYRRKKKKV